MFYQTISPDMTQPDGFPDGQAACRIAWRGEMATALGYKGPVEDGFSETGRETGTGERW